MSEVLKRFRAENPAYQNVDDAALANALYDRFYAGKIPRDQYYTRLGIADTPASNKPPPPEMSPGQKAVAEHSSPFFSALGRGLTLGFGDEIKAGLHGGIRALGGENFSDAYNNELQFYRGLANKQRDEAPVTSFVGEAAGGALTTAPLAVAAMGGRSLGLGQQALRSGAVGAGTGAVQGFGEGEGGLEERLGSAVKGAAVGGTVGAAAPVVAAGVKAAGGKALDIAGLRGSINPDKIAMQKMLQAFEADGIDAATATQRLAEWRRAGGPPAMLMDIGGQNVRDLVRASANYPLGAAKQTAQTAIETRAGEQIPRIYNSIHRALNASDYDVMAERLIADYGRKAKPLYDRAYAAPDINDAQLGATVAKIQRFQPSAVTSAFKMMEAEGVPVGTYDATGKLTRASTQYYDYLKRALDDVINSPQNFNPMTRKFSNEARIAQKLKNEMLSRVDDINPDFKAARAAFADDAAVRRALEDGREFLKLDTIELKEVMRNLHSQAEKEAFQSGVARGLFEKVSGRSDAGRQNLALAFDNADLIARVRTVFPVRAEADRFLTAMRNEAQAFRNQTHVSPTAGSRTTPLANDQAATFGGNVTEAMAEGRSLRGGLTQAVGELARDNWRGISSKVANRLVEALMSPDATANREVLRNLQMLAPRQRQAVIDEVLRRAIGTQVGVETVSAAQR